MAHPVHDMSARERLLDAAEALFGQHGIRATSIRDLAQAASVNLAAVNYHFGSKEGLIAAVLARRADPINRERHRLLDQAIAQAQGAPLTIEQILQAFIRPTLVVMETNPNFLKFGARLWIEPQEEFRNVLLQQFSETGRRFIAALHAALPDIPPAVLRLRFSLGVGSMLHMWISQDETQKFVNECVPGPFGRSVLDEWVRYSAAGLRAPCEEPQQ